MPTTSQYELQINVVTKKSGTGLRDAEKEVDGFGKRLNANIDLLAKSGAAALAAGLTFKKAFELSKEGAQVNQLNDSFELLNRNVLKNPQLLNDMRAAVNGTVKDATLMEGVLKLTAGASNELAQNLANSAPRLLEIAKAAGKLNPTLGDTSFLYESISTGIKRQSPLILDNLGIVVKVGEANERFAESLGKSVDQLTAEEKQMALLNETMEAGGRLIEQVGGSVDSQVDSWERLEVAIGNATDEAKRGFADRLAPILDAAAKTNAQQVQDRITQNLAAADSLNALVEEAQGIDEAFSKFFQLGTRITGTTAEVEAGLVDVTSLMAESAVDFNQFEDAFNRAFGTAAQNQLKFMIGDLREYFFLQKAQGANWQQIAPDLEALNALMAVQEDELLDLTPRWEFLTEKMELTDDQMEALISRFGGVNEATKFLDAAYRDANESAEEYGVTAEELAKIEEDRAKASEDAAKEAQRALEEHLKLLEEIASKQGDYFSQALEAEAGTGLFNEALTALGEQMVVTGGRTADQNRLLDDETL
jgi:hypothetical protein